MTIRDPEVYLYELRPGAEEEYDRHHAAVWPEVVATLRAHGYHEYTIHRRGTLVVSVVRRSTPGEQPEIPAEVQRRVDEWHELMAPLFAAVVDDAGDLLYAEKIFDIADEA